VADPVAGIGYLCQLCGGHAHAYSEDGGHTVEVWDLCQACNDAFEDLADRVAAIGTTAPAGGVDQVPGQLELETGEWVEVELDVDAVLAAVRTGNMAGVSTQDLADVLSLGQASGQLTVTEADLLKGELWRRS
jgi:hypothetical protein